MSVGDLLERVITRLDGANIPHMIAGSFASTYHGEPRTTQDIDIVIDPLRTNLVAFLEGLDQERYYADHDAAIDALGRRSQFNVIDMESGWKIDFIVRKERPFSVEEFQRKQSTELFGVPVFVATAEDTIIAKLEWAKESGSERQLRDVRSIVGVVGEELDRDYIEHWVRELSLSEQWEQTRF